MNRKILLIIYLLFSLTNIYGNDVDSLKLLTHSKNIKVRFEAYTSLGLNKNLPSADRISYSINSLKLAKELKDKKGEAYANFIAGEAYTDAGKYDKAVSALQNSIQIYDSLDIKKLKARSLEALGRTYFYLKQPEKSLEMMKESSAIKIKLGDPKEIGWSFIGIGNVYAIMGKLDKALELYLKALATLEKLKNTENISKVYNNIANIYFAKGEMKKVLPYRLKALKMDRLSNDEQQISYKTYNLGEYYLAVNEPYKALPYITESIKLSEKLQDKELKLDNLKLLTEYYILINNHDSARAYFKKSFSLSQEMFSNDLSKQVGKMQAKYETEKAIKEKQIADFNLSKAEHNKDMWLFLFFIAIIILGVFIYNYFQKKKFNAVLKSEVRQKTFELKQINNELKNNIELLTKAKEKAEESDRLKSAFLANMSHEIRTPMNGILGFTDLLLNPDLSSKEQKSYINLVHKSGQRMLNTVNDIIEISKIEAGIIDINYQVTNLNKQLIETTNFYRIEAEKKGLKLELKEFLPETSENLMTDQNKLDSVLSNLIKNAIKYTETGKILVGCRLNDTEIEYYVKDTGIGIPKNRQKAIFERFVQADIADKNAYQGAGLGLSISKAYVEMLGGKIWVKSEEFKGSTFYFTLPLNNKIKEKSIVSDEKPIQITNKDYPLNKLKILLTEDDNTSMDYLSILVKDFATEILKVKTGKEAIEICHKHKDIDLILMDIQMPELNGYETTRKIREFNKDIVIIAQTAFALAGDQKKAIEAGCNDYITKPVDKNQLQTLIQKYF